MYTVILTPDDNGSFLVTCPELPEVTTFAEVEEDATRRAVDAIQEALAARIARHEDIPTPSAPAISPGARGSTRDFRSGMIDLLAATPLSEIDRRSVRLPPLIAAKVELYRAVRADGVSKAELGRRLGWHGPQVDRLFDLDHRSTIEHLEQALRAIGKRLEVNIEDAA